MGNFCVHDRLQSEVSKVMSKVKTVQGYILLVDVEGSPENPVMKIVDFSTKDPKKSGLRSVLVNTNFKLEEDIYVNTVLKNKVFTFSKENINGYPDYLKNLYTFWGEEFFIFIPIYSEKRDNPAYLCIMTPKLSEISKIQKSFLKIESDIFFIVRSYCFKEKEKSLKDLESSLNVRSNLLELIHDVLNLEKNKHLGIYKKILSFYLEYYKFDLGQILIEKDYILVFKDNYTLKDSQKNNKNVLYTFCNGIKYYPIDNDSSRSNGSVFLRNTYMYFQDFTQVQDLDVTDVTNKYFTITDSPPKSILILPLRYNNKPIGTLGFINYEERMELSEKDLDILLLLTNFSGISFVNYNKHYELINKQDQIAKDLDLARGIHRNLVPDNMENDDKMGLQVSSFYRPFEKIGGDFYNMFDINEETMGIIIGDVMGHGISSALLSTSIRIFIETLSNHQKLDMDFVLNFLNSKILELGNGEYFSFSLYCLYNKESRVLSIVRAGHNYPFLIRNGRVEEIITGGDLLGIFKEIKVEREEIQLFPGDFILMYTDGLTETRDKNKVFFKSKLLKLLSKIDETYSSSDVKEFICKELTLHLEKGEFQDDVCFMVLKVP